ncbi:MAG: 16S rRNA (adenine(1518)-N(6)/adenine(1519)-N(6))-dimethyltransferase RsmA [Candidatus Njordarchaeia archaeon]
MTYRYEILHLCEMFNISLSREMGQNFLISEHVLEKEIEVAELNEDDVVLDIGAGFGFLTEKVAEKVKKVIAIELDKKVGSVFSYRLKNLMKVGRVELILADFLKTKVPGEVTKIVSNPPYSISSDLIVKILKELHTRTDFRLGVMILQKDFVKRLLSKPCGEEWSRISATFNFYAKGEYIQTVSKRNFFPMPDVDSALIRFRFRRDRDFSAIKFEKFEKLSVAIFQGGNKKLRRVLKTLLKPKTPKWKQILSKLEKKVNLEKRVRCVALEDLEKLYLALDRENLL